MTNEEFDKRMDWLTERHEAKGQFSMELRCNPPFTSYRARCEALFTGTPIAPNATSATC